MNLFDRLKGVRLVVREKVRRRRRWLKNVGDPIDLRNRSIDNPNDAPLEKKRERLK